MQMPRLGVAFVGSARLLPSAALADGEESCVTDTTLEGTVGETVSGRWVGNRREAEFRVASPKQTRSEV